MMSDIGIADQDQRGQRRYTIIVNTRQKAVDDRELTFAQVVALAFPGAHDTEVVFTVTYHRAVAPQRDGNLSEGGTVTIKDGTAFDVTRTRRS
ncbi:multiubiquitin domain-containing protein [Micromonospora tulbaghiae]|uniref:multiubiquitin domain-containing protein n=1 Tax=Micromonospora tulbaghiae TaxID=479978 RepID=UPI003EBD4385